MTFCTKYTDYDTFNGRNAAKFNNLFSFLQNSIDVIGNSSHPPYGTNRPRDIKNLPVCLNPFP